MPTLLVPAPGGLRVARTSAETTHITGFALDYVVEGSGLTATATAPMDLTLCPDGDQTSDECSSSP